MVETVNKAQRIRELLAEGKGTGDIVLQMAVEGQEVSDAYVRTVRAREKPRGNGDLRAVLDIFAAHAQELRHVLSKEEMSTMASIWKRVNE